MSLEIPNYTTILIELNKAVKMHNFYPEGHPQLDAALEKSYLLFKKKADDQGEIKWKIDQKGFYDGKAVVAGGNKDVAGLAKKLFFRRIKEITFNHRITLKDLKVLLSVIKSEPEAVQEAGGVETIFADNDVAGILVNALNYDDLRRIKKQLEDKHEQEKNEQAQRQKKVEEAGEAAQSDDELPSEAPAEDDRQDEALLDLLKKIKRETDFLRYQDLSVRIREKVDVLLIEKNYGAVFPAALVYYEHQLPSSGLSEEIRQNARQGLAALLTREMIEYLVGRAGAREEGFRTSIQNMLVTAGTEAAELLLTAIIEAPEALTRKSLFNALVLFGPMIREQVEARLSSPEWYVVRQMVSLLGELGDPMALDAIEKAYVHPDDRVKREVLKSLMKISSPRSTQILLRALEEDDQTLVAQAIISLGVLKDPTVIDVLGAIALKRESFADLMEPKREAIKALGVIGDPRGVPYLSRILSKKVWFGRKVNEEARVLAAYSLGLIGTPEAYDAIEKTLGSSEGELYSACRRILEGREKAHE
ncbi:MAG: HEAT repeat domain-containing protein [Thermodesulfobacteriota bacterium]